MTDPASSLPLDAVALDRLFRAARSVHTFTAAPVAEETVRALYDLVKYGPTAFNAQPARYVFVRSAAAKARLVPTLAGSNKDKTQAAPVTAIIAYDTRFFEHLGVVSPHVKPEMFSVNAALAESTVFRNSALQGAYLILAARALGLAVGPMSGFNADALNQEFFPDGRYRANFLANLGYADGTPPRPRAPRLEFSTVAEMI